MSKCEAHEVGLIDLAKLMRDYYAELVNQGVPPALAERAAGDWHAAALQSARIEIVMRMTKHVASGRVTRDKA